MARVKTDGIKDNVERVVTLVNNSAKLGMNFTQVDFT